MKDSINYLAVTVSAIINFVLAYVWFMFLFRAPYVEGLNKTKEQMDKGPSFISATIMQLIGNLVMSLALAWLMQQLQYHTPVQGLKLPALVWVGFVAAIIGPMYAYEAFSLSFFFITTGIILVYLAVTGVIVGAWQE